ncbi:MAG TPA: hypothetical protein VGR06_28865 [Actinophytocola sp.]|jgi:hypothetical protein|uniref:hypothetical protein n=1 Tax=Actinophytocola sp. TaxID=1872138 RepID=UPI002DFE8092|nr:hypothetical protein [Actinophytocola sp.]
MRGALVAGLLAGLAVSGCATPVGGTAVAGLGAGGSASGRASSQAAPPPLGAAEGLLGAFTSLDPCSLTDPRVFAEFGTARFGVPDSLDDCLVEIRTSASAPVTVYVGSLDRAEAMPDLGARKSTEVPGGLKVVEYAADPGYCNRLVVFADGITLSVNASLYEGEEPRLCDIVRAGVDKAVSVLREGGVRHREVARNSLSWLDPCRLVPLDTLAAVPGLDRAIPRTYPARHGCAWTAADNATRVRVMFTAGPPPKAAGRGATEAPIAGRTSVLSPTPDAGQYTFCGAQTGHIPFRAAGQTGLVEIAGVFVRMPKGQLDAACRAATDVAAALWPKLPKP